MSDQPNEGAGQARGEQTEAPVAGDGSDADRRDVSSRADDAAEREYTDDDGADDAAERDHTDDGDDDRADDREDEAKRREDDAEREKLQEQFAREHDPDQHDVSAGEEFRQEGDWTAEDAGGPQVWDAEGNLVEGSMPGETGQSGQQSGGDGGAGRRTSSLEEIRDGGYGVGSAATIDDGATPLGHPVKAWEDSKTYVTPELDACDEADPHLWFTDADAAERAGFRPVD